MTEPRQDALPVSDDVAQIVAAAKGLLSVFSVDGKHMVTPLDDQQPLVNALRQAVTALSRTTPAAPAEMRHLLATAIFDSENTARLTEHPDELDYYLRRADALIVHMKTLGIGLAALQLPDAKPTFRDGIEAAAKVADERAEACRLAGVSEDMDPIEASILDEHLSECATAIRALATDHG